MHPAAPHKDFNEGRGVQPLFHSGRRFRPWRPAKDVTPARPEYWTDGYFSMPLANPSRHLCGVEQGTRKAVYKPAGNHRGPLRNPNLPDFGPTGDLYSVPARQGTLGGGRSSDALSTVGAGLKPAPTKVRNQLGARSPPGCEARWPVALAGPELKSSSGCEALSPKGMRSAIPGRAMVFRHCEPPVFTPSGAPKGVAAWQSPLEEIASSPRL